MLAWRSSIGWVDESPRGAPVVNEPVGIAEGWTKDILILFSSPPRKLRHQLVSLADVAGLVGRQDVLLHMRTAAGQRDHMIEVQRGAGRDLAVADVADHPVYGQDLGVVNVAGLRAALEGVPLHLVGGALTCQQLVVPLAPALGVGRDIAVSHGACGGLGGRVIGGAVPLPARVVLTAPAALFGSVIAAVHGADFLGEARRRVCASELVPAEVVLAAPRARQDGIGAVIDRA